MIVASHIFQEPVYDPLRVLLLSAIAFLAGGLTYFYIAKMDIPRWKHGMFWGAISAVTFLLVAFVDQLDKLGEDVTWRLPVLVLGVVAGLTGIYISSHYRGHQ